MTGSSGGGADALLEVAHLSVEFPHAGHGVPVVDDVSFTIRRGEVLGLVGESGSGKSVTSQAIMGLVGARGGRIAEGSVRLDGDELVGRSERDWSSIRGARIGMIFQQPTRCLNPGFTVGSQVAEALRRHRPVSRREAWQEAVAMLERVGIVDAERQARAYPHQWSGGMCQRAMIAQALICEPDLLIADEPTTALDVTVQARILELLRRIQEETSVAVLLITHDFGIVAELADRVAVMYAGQVIETGRAADVLTRPTHPYTQALISAVPTEATRELTAIRGNAPAPEDRPSGCRFAPRCDHARDACRAAEVALEPLGRAGRGEEVRCVRAGDLVGKVEVAVR